MPPVVLVVSAAAVAAARATAAVCASAEIPSGSAARISAMPGTRRSARRCVAVDSAGASAGILSAPNSASVDSPQDHA